MYLHIYVCMYTSYNFWRSYVSFGLWQLHWRVTLRFCSVMPGLRATQEVLQWDGTILWTQMLVALKSCIFHRSFYKPKLLGIHLWSPLQEDLMFAHSLTMPTIVSEYLINCHEIWRFDHEKCVNLHGITPGIRNIDSDLPSTFTVWRTTWSIHNQYYQLLEEHCFFSLFHVCFCHCVDYNL